MLWWEEGFCRLLAEGGRFVIRYDHRDTGRSVAYEPGRPEYGAGTLVSDVAAVLDGYGIPVAHVVGVSAGGALVQLFALAFPERVGSLVLLGTSPARSAERELAPPTERFERFLHDARVDWSDPESAVDYVVEYARMLSGGRRAFDEAAVRELVRREAARARSFASRQNHEQLADADLPAAPLSSIVAPTLVIHGTADPLFPLDHGRALAELIPAATLLTLEDAGHGLERADWEAVGRAILEHTADRET